MLGRLSMLIAKRLLTLLTCFTGLRLTTVRPWCNAVPKERCQSTHQLLRKGNAQSFSNSRLLSFISRHKNSNVIINSVFSERSVALFICSMWRHTKKHTSGAKAHESESDLIDSRRVHKPFEGMVISVWEELRCNSLVSFNCNGIYLCMFQKKWALPCGMGWAANNRRAK